MIETIRTNGVKVLLGIIIGFVFLSRVIWPATSIDLGYDQVRDVLVGIEAHQGSAIEYGVPTTGDFLLMPHFYYFTYLTTGISSDPIVTIYAHAIVNLLVLGMFYWICYLFFDKHKLLQSTLSLSLLAFSYQYIWLANAIWNPNIILLPLLLFVLLWYRLHHEDTPQAYVIFYSFTVGVLISIMMGLHATALFAMPVISLVLFFSIPRKFLLVSVTMQALGWVVASSGYLLLEARNNFKNSTNLLDFVRGSSDSYVGFTFAEQISFRIHNYISGWFNIVSSFYFPESYSSYVFLLAGIALIGLFYMKGDRILQRIFLVLLLVYLLVHSGITAQDHPHFMLITSFLPAIGVVNFVVSTLQKSTLQMRAASIAGIILMILSITTNLHVVQRYYMWKYDKDLRVMQQDDYKRIALTLKERGIQNICIDYQLRGYKNVFDFYSYLEGEEVAVGFDCDEKYTGSVFVFQDLSRWIAPDFDETSAVVLIRENNYILYEVD